MSLKDFIEKIVGMKFDDYEKSLTELDKALIGEVNGKSDLARPA